MFGDFAVVFSLVSFWGLGRQVFCFGGVGETIDNWQGGNGALGRKGKRNKLPLGC